MKKYIYIIFIAIQSIFCQTKSGVVEYQVQAIEIKEMKEMIDTYSKNHFSLVKEFNFELKFNQKKSLFFIQDKLYSDKYAAGMSMALIGYVGRTLVKNDTIFSEGATRGIGEYIQYKTSKYNWVLTKESKMIDKYLCYKATTEDVVVNSIKTFRNPVIAWYCPTIPFSYGPLGYNGLPGLILELQTRDGVYGAKKINLSEKEIEIENLKNYKRLSDTELTQKIIEKHGG